MQEGLALDWGGYLWLISKLFTLLTFTSIAIMIRCRLRPVHRQDDIILLQVFVKLFLTGQALGSDVFNSHCSRFAAIVQYPALGNRHIPVACGQAFLGTTQVAHDQSQSIGAHSNCCISSVWIDQTEGNGDVWRIFVCFIGLKLPVGPCVGITLHTWHSDHSI